MIKPLFPEGKEKCLTFSYDDGVTQDIQLLEIFNRYGIKGTFNLNSGSFGKCCPANGFSKPVTHNKIKASQVDRLYSGHEIASHTLTHPRLQYLSEETVEYEIKTDRNNLEQLVGYPVQGMAYPFGTYNETVIEKLKNCGIRYARTIESTNTFGLPKDFFRWHPTCHFGDESMEMLTNRFLNSQNENCENAMLKIFYIWGHSYELDGNDIWKLMEEFCSKVSNKSDIWYATNIQIVEYADAIKSLVYSADFKMVKNNSFQSVWLDLDGKVIEIPAGKLISF